MIKANISKENKHQTIVASGDIPELMNDTAVLINGLYTQLRNADPASALMFRTGMINMIADTKSPVWQPMDNQTGIVFQKPTEED